MYQKPSLQRFGTFRDLTQLGCFGATDLVIPGIGNSTGSIPEIVIGGDGILTTKICFAAISGM